jgi:hypothetical protein
MTPRAGAFLAGAGSSRSLGGSITACSDVFVTLNQLTGCAFNGSAVMIVRRGRALQGPPATCHSQPCRGPTMTDSANT